MFLTKKYNKIILFSLIIVLSFFMVAPAGVASTTMDGLNTTANQGYLGKPGTSDPTGIPTDMSTTIGKIVGVVLSFLGIIFFVLIIMGGYMWMTSMGNEQAAGKAKDIILAAVIGLFIVLIAYAATILISGIFVKTS